MKKKPTKSAFGAFFRKQAGQSPISANAYFRLRDEIEELDRQLFRKRALLRKQEDYHIKRQYALYAWCARDKK